LEAGLVVVVFTAGLAAVDLVAAGLRGPATLFGVACFDSSFVCSKFVFFASGFFCQVV
jgi:hypothetical protein